MANAAAGPHGSSNPSSREGNRSLRELLRQLPPTLRLVWEARPSLAIGLVALGLIAAVLPAAIAYVGKLIIDGVVLAARSGLEADRERVLLLVALELGLMLGSTVVLRAQALLRELLRGLLGNAINLRILQKALDLELRHFEDSEVYDKLQNARREASSRPLSLAMQSLTIGQNLITLITLSALLVRLSPWIVVVLLAASVPAFLAEVKMSAQAFRLFSWRAPEGRRLNYLEWILTRDSHVKEVKSYGLGEHFLGRYRALFDKFYREDRVLAFRRMRWGLAMGLVSLVAFYGIYGLVAHRAASGEITLGDMTLALAVFRQGQAAFQGVLSGLGGMYEDALFMSNLFSFLAIPTLDERPALPSGPTVAKGRALGIELEGVSFRYPGKEEWALRGVSLSLRAGEKLGLVGENGAGKSTLVKLLLRLYEPTEGRILVDGVDLRRLDPEELRSRVGIVYQDFVRYQLTAAENIGLGDVGRLGDRPRIIEAAERAGAGGMLSELPSGMDTMLGGWFEKGQELSGGQWQKLAIGRAFMREAGLLILDEPTASIDAQSEHELFERFQQLSADRTAIIISHRFSTVRLADRIAVFQRGELRELGTHRELLERGERYAHLFRLQAQGYLD